MTPHVGDRWVRPMTEQPESMTFLNVEGLAYIHVDKSKADWARRPWMQAYIDDYVTSLSVEDARTLAAFLAAADFIEADD
jgi:hypothetical protein